MELSSFTRTAKVTTRKEKINIDRTTETVEVDIDFTQMYNCFCLLSFRINNGTSFQLLFFILKNMDKNNIIKIDKEFKERFYSLYQLVANKKAISEPSFYSALKELVRADVIKPIEKKGRGVYVVNAYVLWKDDKQRRIDFLGSDSSKKGAKFSFNPVRLLEGKEIPEERVLNEYIDITEIE